MMMRGFNYVFAPVNPKSYFSFKGTNPVPKAGAGDLHLGLSEFKEILKVWEAEREDLNARFLKAAPWATHRTLEALNDWYGLYMRVAIHVRRECLEHKNAGPFSDSMKYMNEKRWQTKNDIFGPQASQKLAICPEIISPMNKAHVLVTLIKMAEILRPAMREIEAAMDAGPNYPDLKWQRDAVKGFIEYSRAVCGMILCFSPERAERLNQIILTADFEGTGPYVAAFKASQLTEDKNVFKLAPPRPPRLPRERTCKEM